MATATVKLIELNLKLGPRTVRDLVNLIGVNRVNILRALKRMEADGKVRICNYYKPLVGAYVPVWSLGTEPSVPKPEMLSDATKKRNAAISKQFYKLNQMLERRDRLAKDLAALDRRILQVRNSHETMRRQAADEAGLSLQ